MVSKKKVLIIGLVVLVMVIAGATVAYLKVEDKPKDKTQIDIVNKYLDGYKKPDLAAVRDVVSSDMKDRLPADQKAFKKQLDGEDKTNGRVTNWKILASDTNEYVGQTMVDVEVNTTKRKYTVYFDITGDDKQGWKIRAVKEKKANDTGGANMGGMGMQAPENHGMQ
jgi:uncharacterized membrane protein YdfJ with MMPL/SSD domain